MLRRAGLVKLCRLNKAVRCDYRIAMNMSNWHLKFPCLNLTSQTSIMAIHQSCVSARGIWYAGVIQLHFSHGAKHFQVPVQSFSCYSCKRPWHSRPLNSTPSNYPNLQNYMSFVGLNSSRTYLSIILANSLLAMSKLKASIMYLILYY